MELHRMIVILLTVGAGLLLWLQYNREPDRSRTKSPGIAHITRGIGVVVLVIAVIAINLVTIDEVFDWRYITHLVIGGVFFLSAMVAFVSGNYDRVAPDKTAFRIHKISTSIVTASFILSLLFAVVIRFR